MPAWEPSFDFYMANVDGAPASFVVDLAADAPVATHPVRLHVRVQMQRPRPDGLRDGSEFEELGKLEDDVVDRIEKALDAIYVARMVHQGYSEMFFYLPQSAEKRAEDVGAIIGDVAPYEPEWFTEEDEDWSFYGEFLYPDAYSMQTIQNRRLIHQIKEQGDALDVPREIDHMAYFPTRQAAEQAAAALTKRGFTCDEIDESEDNISFEFHRKDAIAGDRPDEFCREILDVLIPLEADYDGWGTMIVKP